MAAPLTATVTPYGYTPSLYHCLLDEQPHYLVPRRLYGNDAAGSLIVNPQCWFSWRGAMPSDVAKHYVATEGLLRSDWVVVVADPASEALWPYLVGEEYQGYLYGLTPGLAPVTALPAHAVWVLMRAGILVEPDYVLRRREQWRRALADHSATFRRGYVNVAGLIPPLHVGALRRYYRFLTRTGSLTFGDRQVDRRHTAHNENVARYVHCQLASVVSELAQAAVKPSYSYLAVYENGAVLERHTDRDQCEYSITLCLDATPEPAEEAPWPIDLDTDRGRVRMRQFLGDALLYRGRQVAHSRSVLPSACSATALLLHYVDWNFGGSLS